MSSSHCIRQPLTEAVLGSSVQIQIDGSETAIGVRTAIRWRELNRIPAE